MKEIEFKKLRMIATSSGGVYRLEISIASGFVDFLRQSNHACSTLDKVLGRQKQYLG